MINRYIVLSVLGLALTFPATGFAKDIQYFTIEDATTDQVLLQEKGLEERTWYTCSLSSLACSEAAADTKLVPSALASSLFYYLSPRNDQAVVTNFVPGKGPVHTLNSIKGNSLVEKETLPFTMDIKRVRYSDDGKVLIITQVDGSIVRYDTSSKKVTPITSFPAGASWIQVSPNGRYVAYYIPATLSRGMRTFGVVDTVKDKTYTFDEPTQYWDLLTEGTTLFAFSPNNSSLVYLSDRDGYPTLYQVSLSALDTAGIKGTRLITKPYTISEFVWKDNTTLLLTANKETPLTYSLYTYTIASGAMTKVIDNTSYDSAMIKVGDKVLFSRIQGTARIPAVYSISTGAVSNFSVPGLTTTANKPGTIVKAGELSGVWLQPSKSSNKLVVWLHGGPYRQVSPVYHSYYGYAGYDWLLDNVTDAGVAVLKLDYPGSQGYGRAFAESITKQVGGDDVTKTLAAVKAFAKEHGYNEIYLMGNSYGGYLSLKMIVDHPNEFEGAFSINGVTDWDVLTANLRTSIFNVHFGGIKNGTNDALYEKASILANIDDLSKKDKIYIAHGDKDMTVPYAQSKLLADALKKEKLKPTFITFKGEDHVYMKEKTFISLCKNVFKFVGEKGKCSI